MMTLISMFVKDRIKEVPLMQTWVTRLNSLVGMCKGLAYDPNKPKKISPT